MIVYKVSYEIPPSRNHVDLFLEAEGLSEVREYIRRTNPYEPTDDPSTWHEPLIRYIRRAKQSEIENLEPYEPAR